ncbi:Cmx/CmrA family chloramphenicol efflux MFS transporter [Streptomyces sp. NPDC005963]|uniref:Cmx/CmrA family chloramphenicol efflux MFS transporter n=1 Tax=Streptomyces sp. NPDC005963 TaxID=3156721 RepID=UPI0033C877CE
MPPLLYVLGLAVFAQGTSEFMLSGLLPDIARDLDVSIPAAGFLTSAFAVGMVIGAPLMAMASMRWSRRRALLAFLLTFLVVHVVGALTTTYAVLLATRIVAALANAGFLAVALATATALVPAGARGRATSILVGGITLACVAGVPGGALLGQLWGWRSAFWAVALLSVPAVFAILKTVPNAEPNSGPSAAPRGVRRELLALKEPRLLITLSVGALINGATFCAFTYLAPLVIDVTAVGAGWVPAVLALFGLGSFLGVTVAGRISDVRPWQLLSVGTVALCIGWAVFALWAHSLVVALGLVFLQGALSFSVGSTMIAQMLAAAPAAPTLSGAYATAAFNVGAAIGPWIGGVAIATGGSYRSPLWVSALLVVLALITGGAAAALNLRGAESPRPGRQDSPYTGEMHQRH